MTDRGTPDGTIACPFVAFEDDRDARSTAPDHRHRCFAEPVPAPRAIAHQDAYCLSPAFAVCPTFQDWARREAAAARPAGPASAPVSRAREEDSSGPVPLPPGEREGRHALADAAQPLPPRRPAARDWAAPPPWFADADGDAERGAGPGEDEPSPPGRSRYEAEWGSAARGLANSPAARLAGPDPDLPTPARPTPSRGGGESPDDALHATPTPYPASSSRHPAPPSREPGQGPARDPQELFGPAWERPRRYEAYPSLRTRVGLPSFGGVPRLAVAAVALVVAAAVLFFVSPILLGLGRQSPASSAAPSVLASAGPSPSVAPTVAPPPTPFAYTIVKGDTLSTIASRFGVTIDALRKANSQIKNINAIREGDQITIPAPSGGGAPVSGASPSAVSGASTGP